MLSCHGQTRGLIGALLRSCVVGRARALRCSGSDGAGECSEGFREPMPRVGIKAEFVVAAVEVLHERARRKTGGRLLDLASGTSARR